MRIVRQRVERFQDRYGDSVSCFRYREGSSAGQRKASVALMADAGSECAMLSKITLRGIVLAKCDASSKFKMSNAYLTLGCAARESL